MLCGYFYEFRATDPALRDMQTIADMLDAGTAACGAKKFPWRPLAGSACPASGQRLPCAASDASDVRLTLLIVLERDAKHPDASSFLQVTSIDSEANPVCPAQIGSKGF